MRISAIKQQINRANHYSIFIDGQYSLSLSDQAVLDSGVVVGQELTTKQFKELTALANADKLFGRTLRYVSLTMHSEWEVRTYLERLKASPALVNEILSKLSNLDLVDDTKLAEAYIRQKINLSPASRRKIIADLRKKRVAEEVIKSAMASQELSDTTTLQSVIARKRRQTKYQNPEKLMQYLARQGYNYGDIKAALSSNDDTWDE